MVLARPVTVQAPQNGKSIQMKTVTAPEARLIARTTERVPVLLWSILALVALFSVAGAFTHASLLRRHPVRTGLVSSALLSQRRAGLLEYSGWQQEQQQLALPLDDSQEEDTQSATSAAAAAAAVAAPATTEEEPCKKLLWFTCVGGQTRADSNYFKFLRAALLSARTSAPSLVPVLLYAGQADEVTAWYEAHGGTVAFHTLSFIEDFQAQANQTWRDALLRRQGIYLRLDIPLVVEQLAHSGRLDLTNTSTRLALYTDADVLFMGQPGQDLSTCTLPRPQLLMVSPEATKGTAANTGVILYNVPAAREALPHLVQFGREHSFDFPAHDQGLILAYMRAFNHPLIPLPDRLNWKGYWGPPPRMEGVTILHWHGAKPQRCLPCLLNHSEPLLDNAPGWRGLCPNCPPTYVLLYQRSPDRGEFYRESLLAFNRLQRLAES